jgi:hypothetical protein
MTMRLFRFAAVALLGLSVTGCATVIRGTSTKFDVTSEPSGAAVHTNNGFSCQATPCNFRMSRKDSFDITVSMDGYVSQTVHVKSKAATDGVALMTGGNFLLGGIIGSAVDVADGATNRLVPNPLNVILQKVGGESGATASATPASDGAAAGTK